MYRKEKKRTLKISPLRLLVIVCCGMLTGLCVYFVNAGLAAGSSGSQSAMPFGVGAGVVLSGSMEPELMIDDLIFFRKADEYNVGDVVVYYSDGISVVHRVIEVSGSDITTKGDANNTADEPVSASDVRGTLAARLPGGGRVVDFLRSPFGVFIVLGLAVLLLELSFRREKQRGDRSVEELKAEIRRLKEQSGGEPDGSDEDKTNI